MEFVVSAEQSLELAARKLKLRGEGFIQVDAQVQFLRKLSDDRDASRVHLSPRVRDPDNAGGLVSGKNDPGVQVQGGSVCKLL